MKQAFYMPPPSKEEMPVLPPQSQLQNVFDPFNLTGESNNSPPLQASNKPTISSSPKANTELLTQSTTTSILPKPTPKKSVPKKKSLFDDDD